MRSLTIGVHGESGAGKSWLADTAPGPRCVLDVEGGTRFTPSNKVPWDPKEAPPDLGPQDTAVVTVTNLDSIQRAFQWGAAGTHPFNSWVIDSLTEAQDRVVDVIAGTDQPKLQDYGTLLRKVKSLVRSFRDLTLHQTNPAQVIVFVSGSAEKGQENPVVRPALIGRMAEQLPYYLDVQAYLSVETDSEGELVRRALFVPTNGIAAKDRTGRLGVSMVNPSIPAMLELVYGPEGEGA